jgi:hypothetical protein
LCHSYPFYWATNAAAYNEEMLVSSTSEPVGRDFSKVYLDWKPWIFRGTKPTVGMDWDDAVRDDSVPTVKSAELRIFISFAHPDEPSVRYETVRTYSIRVEVKKCSLRDYSSIAENYPPQCPADQLS